MSTEREFAAAHRARLEAEQAKTEADARALADVRTLDDWAAQETVDCQSRTWHSEFVSDEWVCCLQWESQCWDAKIGDHLVESFKDWRGATPDEARAKAAAWVREQKP